MKALTINVDSTKKYLQIFNGIFNLTEMELEVLSYLIDNQGDDINLCSASNKRKAADLLKIDDYRKLNNYVKRLKDKGAISYVARVYNYNSLLNPLNNEIKITINRN